jgi:plastocyanin
MKNSAIALSFTFGATSLLFGLFQPEKEASLPFPDGVEICGPKTTDAAPKKKVTFLSQDADKKEVNLTIVATYNADNHGMNFNGYSKGKAGYQIPTGWKVNVTFENWSPVPHSVIVVEDRVTRKPQMGQPYFDGATTPNANLATTPKEAKFSFEVDEPGDFAFACGFPAHAASGHWIKLEVSDDYDKTEFVTPEK